jgi:hypothetical protein
MSLNDTIYNREPKAGAIGLAARAIHAREGA